MGVDELRRRARHLTIADRRRVERRIKGAARIGVRSKREAVLAAIERDVADSEIRVAARRAAVPATIAYPESLPITARRSELLATIRDHQVVIVAGETGSGKSTQLPKLCLELGRGVDGFVGQTQPRRIAARTIAERVASELGTAVGTTVGYAMRFTDTVADDTLVKVMTDGLLLAEVQGDRLLSAYDTIIIDEAHERSLNIDFLLGYLKRLCVERPDLKVIVTSATIDTARFSQHFDGAPVVEVSGRAHPVEIRYREPVDGTGDPREQPDAICDAVRELSGSGTGDILVFCSGEREIRDAAEALSEMRLPNTEILPLYARLSSAEQHRVFAPHQGRRIVLATNVAETSLTVPGVRHVVDPGTARISRYSRRTKVQRLPIEPISRASADQRAGRCGRLGPGICIRLYAEADYLSRPEFTEPETLRTSLASVILQMAAAGLGEIESFPFLEAPDARSVRDGLLLLEELGAVEPDSRPVRLTATGRTLARIPADPRIGRMLVAAAETGCLAEVLIIAAGLSIIDPRERPTGQESKADALHSRFEAPGSDLLGWLRLWEHVSRQRRSLTSNRFRRMCREEYLNHRRVREWQDVHSQLRRVAAEVGLRGAGREVDSDTIHRAVLAGLLSHVGRRDGHEYRGARGARFSIAPGSVLFKQSPEWVMASDLVETTRMWARGVAKIDPAWIEGSAAHLVTRSYSEPWWDAESGSAMAHETVSLYGIPVVSERPVQFGMVDPSGARTLFIRHALVHGEWDSFHAFVRHNRAVFAEVEALEARFRTDLREDDDTVHAFFDERVPEDVTAGRHFDAWWRRVVDHDPHRLDLSIDDVLVPEAARLDAEEFPDEWHHGDLVAPIHYAYQPGSDIDGVIIDVPAAGLDRLDPSVFEWHVPGHREELVVSLIRSLPKSLRKAFLPMTETAGRVLERPPSGGLLDHVRRELSRISGLSIVADDFDLGRLPPHLKPTFRVVDDEGGVLAVGDDLASLRTRLRSELRETVARRSHPIERSGITVWDFGDLPPTIRVAGPLNAVTAFPALVDQGDSVAIRVLATPDEQAEAMWFGTRRLLTMRSERATRLLDPLLSPQTTADMTLGPYESKSGWVSDCVESAAEAVLSELGGPVWTAAEFERLTERAADRLGERIVDVGRASLDLFAALRDLQIAVNAATGPLFEAAVADIRSQVVRLVYPGFLAAIGPGRIADVERYLRGMAWRLDRLPERPDRDAEQMSVVGRLESEHIRLMESIRVTPELIEIGWMLQELRVSYFAQPLGTRGSVSAKRLAAALREAELAV
jgi:ATP-dependent helicase HrpA